MFPPTDAIGVPQSQEMDVSYESHCLDVDVDC